MAFAMARHHDVTLFTERTRTDDRQAGHAERLFPFLDRVAGRGWDRVRENLDEWFRRYPEQGRNELRAAFRGRYDSEFYAKFWELYLHEAHRRLGFRAELHPALSDAEHCPDFRFTRADASFLLEATIVVGDSLGSPQDRNEKAWIYGLIEKVANPNFFLDPYFDAIGEELLGTKDVTVPLCCWLDGLDPNVLRAEVDRGEPPRQHRLTARGWDILVRAWGVGPEHRGNPHHHRMIGTYDMEIGSSDHVRLIKDRLREKAKHYGRPEEPFVLALLCPGNLEDDDVKDALFGELDGPPNSRPVSDRRQNGFWIPAPTPTGTRVSAVLTGAGIGPLAITNALPCLWANPWATNRLEPVLPWPRQDVDAEHKLQRTEGTMTGADLFELPSAWPGPEPRFPRHSEGPG